MPDIKSLLSSIKSGLSGLVTADNTESVSKVSADIDSLEKEVDTLENSNSELKDKIVEMVKGTIVGNKPPKDDVVNETPKTLDEIMLEEAKKIVSENKK